MMQITLNLTDSQEKIVNEYINHGEYKTPEDVFLEGLSLLAIREKFRIIDEIKGSESAKIKLKQRVIQVYEQREKNKHKPIDPQRQKLAKEFRELCAETQALHADNPLTDEEIQAEIDAYRRGE